MKGGIPSVIRWLLAWWHESIVAVGKEWKRLTPIAVPWLLGLMIGLPLLWFEADSIIGRNLDQARDQAASATVNTLLRRLDRLESDVLFLSDLPAHFAQPGVDIPADSPLATTLLSFSNSTRRYDKVRWLDNRGRERLRVNNHGTAELVPTTALQDKASRSFFTDTRSMQKAEVYFSELDLNVDDGVIERPYRPTLRAVSTVYFGDTPHGVIVLNARMQDILERLKEERTRTGLGVYLLSGSGSWILGPDPADDWASQLDAPQRLLPKTNPALWSAMQRAESGVWRGWKFSTLRAGLADRGETSRAKQAGALDLRVLVRADDAMLAATTTRWKWLLLVLTLFSVALTISLILRTARGMAAESLHLQKLEEANAALRVANERLQRVRDDLVRAERLSSLGMMVAGVAHEMNTPLGSSLLALSTVQDGVSELTRKIESGLRRSDLDAFIKQASEALDLAAHELRRSSGLVQRFKQVAVDRTTLQRRRFDLSQVILDADPRLRGRDYGGRVTFQLELEPGLEMDSYPGPIEQVISNLITNALTHAYEPDQAGLVIVCAQRHGDAHVEVSVVDSGAGIRDADLPRVFEPFFTTRRSKGGSGLGLHIAHQIVTEVLGGTIRVRSRGIDQAGAGTITGTSFTLRLPRHAPTHVDVDRDPV